MNDLNLKAKQRQFLRAPLKANLLYVDGEYVLKAKISNISENGILLSEVPHVPEVKTLFLAFRLIKYPRFQSYSLEQLRSLALEDFTSSVLKTKAQLIRSFEGLRPVDRIFVNFIGCAFIDPPKEFNLEVYNYVETFAKNIVYLLSLFESLGNRAEQLELLKTVAFLLGYDRQMKVPLLRAKVLHDYQGLESL